MVLFFVFSAVLIASCAAADNAAAPPAHSASCVHRNGYVKDDTRCDTYIECKNYIAVKMSCPDGLNYDAAVSWPNYPCGYPMDVPCSGPSQPAKPTADCPHQFGYFPSPLATPKDCGHYRFCVEGKAMEMFCPPGLAFNPAISRCDWADRVPTCDVEAFIGFKCPPATYDENGNALVTNHKFNGNCQSFYSCQAGDLPRLLSCDEGEAFDDSTGRCEEADKVDCPRGNALAVLQ